MATLTEKHNYNKYGMWKKERGKVFRQNAGFIRL
jgi:hypothetical protein